MLLPSEQSSFTNLSLHTRAIVHISHLFTNNHFRNSLKILEKLRACQETVQKNDEMIDEQFVANNFHWILQQCQFDILIERNASWF